MELSQKAVRFVTQALDHYIATKVEEFKKPGLADDEVADLTNDLHYLEAIKEDFVKLGTKNFEKLAAREAG